MAGLADDWEENRQTCVDVLCACLRLPYDPDPGEDAAPPERAAYRANREVRHTIIRLIGDHLRPDVAVSWQGLNLDFTGVVFDGGDFGSARFSGGMVRFEGASFDQIIDSIDQRLFTLPPDLLVHPGHGLDTTLGTERPHLQEWVDRGW